MSVSRPPTVAAVHGADQNLELSELPDIGEYWSILFLVLTQSA